MNNQQNNNSNAPIRPRAYHRSATLQQPAVRERLGSMDTNDIHGNNGCAINNNGLHYTFAHIYIYNPLLDIPQGVQILPSLSQISSASNLLRQASSSSDEEKGNVAKKKFKGKASNAISHNSRANDFFKKGGDKDGKGNKRGGMGGGKGGMVM